MPRCRAASGVAHEWPAIKQNFALVRRVNAGEDFAHGAFARAIFSHERVARPALDFEADAIEA